MLDDDDLKLGDEQVDFVPTNKLIINGQKIDTILGYGRSGSVICKGINK